MYEITLIHRTSTAHRVVGHEGKCARLHGHEYNWTVTVRAEELGSPEFVIDFAHIKDVLNAWDHRTLLWRADPLGVIEVGYDGDYQPTEHGEALFGIVRLPVNPTSELLSHLAAHLIFSRAVDANPSIASVEVVCSETPSSRARALVTDHVDVEWAAPA